MDKIEFALIDVRLSVIEALLCKDESFKSKYVSIFSALTDVITSFEDNTTQRQEVAFLIDKHLNKIQNY